MEEISDDKNKKGEKENKNIKEEDINILIKKLEEKFTIEDTLRISFKKLISKKLL